MSLTTKWLRMCRCYFMLVTLVLILRTGAARAEDCRDTFRNEFMGEIERDLAKNLAAPRVEGCEISRSGAEVSIRVEGSVLARVNSGFLGRWIRRRIYAWGQVVLSSSCTQARVVNSDLRYLDIVSSDWQEKVARSVLENRHRPPLRAYCSK